MCDAREENSESSLKCENLVYDQFSIHSNSIAEIYDVPMSEIRRPIPSILDEEKVKSIMQSLEV